MLARRVWVLLATIIVVVGGGCIERKGPSDEGWRDWDLGTSPYLPPPDLSWNPTLPPGDMASPSGACKPGGTACQAFTECCSGTCANQICTSCGGEGQSCDEGCCQELTCYDGQCLSCRQPGTSCTLAADCCSNICTFGTCAQCIEPGGYCEHSNECCDGQACIDGQCGGAGGACIGYGTSCGDCCASTYQYGREYHDSELRSCLCQANRCATPCADLCQLGFETQTCSDCEATGVCDADVASACALNSGCKSYEACLASCG